MKDVTYLQLTSSLVIPCKEEGTKETSFWHVLRAEDSKWGLPTGKVGLSEQPPLAGLRGALEEMNCRASLGFPIGAYYFINGAGEHPILNIAYSAEFIADEKSPQSPQANPINGILAVRAFTLRDLEDLCKKGSLHLDEASLAPVSDYVYGNPLPPDFLKTFF